MPILVLRARVRLAPALAAALLLLGGRGAAHGFGFGLFQHGGRGAAQAGALVARADDPSAVRYDPAALVDVDGLAVQAGLDFAVTDVEHASALTGRADAEHEIQFTPAVYLAWRPAPEARWALGLSLDSPLWTLQEWPAGFAAGRSSRKNKAAFHELRAAAAWAFAPGWSVGGALRHATGKRQETVLADFPGPPATGALPLTADAESTLDGQGLALALRRSGERWGWAASFESEVELAGDGDLRFRPDGFDPGDVPGFDALYATRGVRQEFLLPARFAVGAWWTLGARTRIELDVERARWSALERTAVRLAGGGEFAPLSYERRWEDVTSVRLGGEHRFASGWRLAAGAAHEPSPVPDATRDFAFPQGDATVYALGGGYDLPRISFDFGWSLHDHDAAAAPATEIGIPSPSPRFSARGQVFAVSARWRLSGAG
jgi:long-chain fatty acid transport protein